jgi:hypothetical protein
VDTLHQGDTENDNDDDDNNNNNNNSNGKNLKAICKGHKFMKAAQSFSKVAHCN